MTEDLVILHQLKTQFSIDSALSGTAQIQAFWDCSESKLNSAYDIKESN